MNIFPYSHNWNNNFSIKYGYNTNIYTSTALKEQRRALRRSRNPTVEIRYEILIAQNKVDTFMEMIEQKEFIFANESEQIIVRNPKLSIITPLNDTSNFFMLNKIDNLYLMNGERSEARTVVDVSNSKIVIDERFYYNTNMLYVAFKGIIINVSFNYLARDICSYSLTIRKIIE